LKKLNQVRKIMIEDNKKKLKELIEVRNIDNKI